MVCDSGSDVLAHDLVDVQHIQVDTAQLKHVRVACISIGKSLSDKDDNHSLDYHRKEKWEQFMTNFYYNSIKKKHNKAVTSCAEPKLEPEP